MKQLPITTQITDNKFNKIKVPSKTKDNFFTILSFKDLTPDNVNRKC